MLEVADLEPRLTFPEGGRPEVARLSLICRKTQLVIAEQDLSANDLANFLARRATGSLEGESRLLNVRQRAHLNMERRLVTVRISRDVDVFDLADSRYLPTWMEDAARAYGAQDVRISKTRGGYDASLVFFFAEFNERGELFLNSIRDRFTSSAELYMSKARDLKASK